MMSSFKRMQRYLVGAGIALATCAPVAALADDPLGITMPTISITDYGLAATAVLTALALIWPVRKLIKLFNKS